MERCDIEGEGGARVYGKKISYEKSTRGQSQ